MRVQLSAVIITFNEEKNIERCITSVKEVVDEILVVDSFSTDATQEICENHGVRFLEHKFEGHIEQKNWAKDQAKFDFILSLDADEALDDELKNSVLEVKNNWQKDAYKMNRLTNYCGKWIHHSGWYPDTKLRLFDRRKGHWGGNNPHDKYIPAKGASAEHLQGDILHYSFYTRNQHLKQIESFSTIGAKALFKKGKRSNVLKLIIKPLARFVKAYIIHLGFLDGKAGFTISRLSAYANYLKYAKLQKLQKGRNFNLTERKKVLHIATALSWRGGEQQLAYLVEELQEEIDQVVLCSEGSELASYCKKKGIDFITQKKRGGFDLAYARKITTLCKELEIDLCHMHDAHAHTFAIIAAVMGNKTSLVLSRRVDFPIKQKFTSKFKYNHPVIKKILCVSEMIKEITAPDIKEKSKLHTVYSGIDLTKFSARKGKLRKELGINDSTFLVGNTSALADHKDYFTFLETAEKVVKAKPEVQFVIMGDGPMADEIKAYAKSKKLESNVTFTGYRNDIPEVLADLDIFLITSKTEGLGTSILDAFACEVPVVATNAGGIPELVENRKTGLLCSVKNVDEISSAILKIINDPITAKKLAKAAKNKVQQFSKSETAKQTLAHYQDVWG